MMIVFSNGALLMKTTCINIILLLAFSLNTLAGHHEKPNVILILSDDQAYNDYSFMGHEHIKTPAIDKLASESLVYTRGYVTTSICSPSLATMLTGLYPHEHKTTGNDPHSKTPGAREAWLNAFDQCPLLPKLLAEAGYRSHQSGKLWQGHYKRVGFDEGMTTEGRHGGEGLKIGREGLLPVYEFMKRMKADKDPFFVWYAPFLPHTPHNPPERLLKKYSAAPKSQRKYYAMCEWFDETCRDLLKFIDDEDLRENTVIVYICDNGWGSLGQGSVKMSPYDLGARTPIMIRWPEKLKPEMDHENFASNLDIVPTILKLAGAQIPAEMSGINLLNKEAAEKREFIFLENFTHDMLEVDKPELNLRSRSVLSKDGWKLTVWNKPDPRLKVAGWRMPAPDTDIELFRPLEDLKEKNNLADANPEKVAELRSILDAWWNPLK